MKVNLLIFLLMISSEGRAKSVMVGGEKEFDACSSEAEVFGLKKAPDSFLAVRDKPSRNGKELDRLSNGMKFYFCEESGDWVGIVYAKKPTDRTSGADCGVSTPIKIRRAYRGPCSSGWVHKRWIRVISG